MMGKVWSSKLIKIIRSLFTRGGGGGERCDDADEIVYKRHYAVEYVNKKTD